MSLGPSSVVGHGALAGTIGPGALQAIEGVRLFEGTLVLPPGDVAEALAELPPGDGVPSETDPAPSWPPWLFEAGKDPWADERPWRLWVELLRAEARDSAPENRARLAQLARLQERDADAWRHVVGIRDGSLARTVLPLLLPGVPSEHLGRKTLPAGVLLRPALPPPADGSEGTLRSLVGRPARAERIRIADSLVSLQVVVEADGVQVDLNHLAGPPVELRVQAPVPPGVRLELLYVDWERVDDPGAPVELRLEDSEEGRQAVVWGRFLPREPRWPGARHAGSPDPGARPAPIEIVHDGPAPPRLARFGEALEELFRRPSRLVESKAPPTTKEVYEPIRLHFEGPPTDDAHVHKLRAMISLAERWALAADGLAGEVEEQ